MAHQQENPHLSLITACRSEVTKKEREESGKNFSQGLGGVGNHNLPDMERSLPHQYSNIRPTHVEPSQYPVAPLWTQDVNNGLQYT